MNKEGVAAGQSEPIHKEWEIRYHTAVSYLGCNYWGCSAYHSKEKLQLIKSRFV